MESNSDDYQTPEKIRDYALSRFNSLAPAKYDRGQQEHGGLITDRPMLQSLEEEIIDAFFYIQALRLKLNAREETNQEEGGKL